MKKRSVLACAVCAFMLSILCMFGCSQQQPQEASSPETTFANVADTPVDGTSSPAVVAPTDTSDEPGKPGDDGTEQNQGQNDQIAPAPEPASFDIYINEDYRPSLNHGEKGAAYQKYIVLHDTEGEGDPQNVINYWDGDGNLVAAHFVIGKDGSIWQCVPMDNIAHHAGFGDAGHNDMYGIVEDGRDDMLGTVPIGDWAPDYGMNAWSIGIEMVHVGGTGYYPEEQLEALDSLIAYIDAYYGGYAGAIIDHKAWRSGNSDTSPEFAEYLANYQDHRTHN